MQVEISDLAQEFGIVPGQVLAVLSDLGVHVEGSHWEADADTLEIVREALRELQGSKVVAMTPNKTPRDIAQLLGVSQPEVQKTLMTKMKVMATLTTTLKPEVAERLVGEFGYELKWVEPAAPTVKVPQTKAKPGKTPGASPRPPVVTIMGHVDHGKTSLLDYIRKSNVVAKEHGGITQHIGAYQTVLPEGTITFLDTPGHAAFTAMRARGAEVTDIAILVVAADDGIMPQTIEAINHAKNAGVPVIVAVNKIDKPEANPDRVIRQLPEHGLVPEAFGGDVIVCPVSAVTGEGVPHLLEMILLQAEVMQLTADPTARCQGVCIEAQLEKGRGPVATVLVQQGTLKVGDVVVVGNTWGRIKAMTDYRGERIKQATPSMPAVILGLSDVPMAGDRLETYADERAARSIAEDRQEAARLGALAGTRRRLTLGDLRESLATGTVKDLHLVVKADVQGSLEAVTGMLEKLEHPEVSVDVIHSGVGSITESDILLASAANAIVIGFNVRPEPGAKASAERHKVEIRLYSIIYELIEDIEAAIKGMLAPKFQEEYLGTAEIRVVFNLSKKGKVAGSHILDGKLNRGCDVRVTRDGELVYTGKLSSLKHFKDDVRTLAAGNDCGITFEGWTDFKEGDKVEAFEVVQVG